MIDKIYILTVNRPDNQITFNNLPEKYQKKTVLVVQDWEREKYSYPCEYFVLPKDYHYSDYLCLPKTRRLVFEIAQDTKYAVFDDDLKFNRRNAKYFGDDSNMETSNRPATVEDFDLMFETFDAWLDEVTVCGTSQVENPPGGPKFRDNASLSSAFWMNGPSFKHFLPELPYAPVMAGEDIFFLLTLLSNGFKNRVSGEFVHTNISNTGKIESTIWDRQTYEKTLNDHLQLEKLFPGIYNIARDSAGKRLDGGYRNFGKSKVYWSKAFNSKVTSSLDDFFG